MTEGDMNTTGVFLSRTLSNERTVVYEKNTLLSLYIPHYQLYHSDSIMSKDALRPITMHYDNSDSIVAGHSYP